jgi:hypothetical protein
MGRTSTANRARSNAGAALGPALVRCSLAYQRRNRWSPARLGATTAALASVPHSSANWATRASATSNGIPIG